MLENFGRYQLLRKLATGGMGQVFLARQRGPVGFEKLVVVKRILPHLSEEDEFINMFFDEARIAANLNHPNIAQIYDLGEAEGTYYIAMEYVHGQSVREANTRANNQNLPIPLALKCRIIADAAAGLDFAHRARSPSGQPLHLIHRDVSPQNILVGFNGAVKLIDFGVAKAAGKISTTLTGAIKGKYAYMSPEQARGEDDLDLRSDVFGLGVVFFELLTNVRLFKRESDNATLRAVIGAKITPPSTVVKGIPKALDGIVLKALARKRNERFQTAGEFLLTLEDFLVRQRLPSTNAQLSAFLQELYADQMQQRVAPEPTQASHASAAKASTQLLRPSKPSQPSAAPHGAPSTAQTANSRSPERARPEPREQTASLTDPPQFQRGAAPPRSRSTSGPQGKSGKSAKKDAYYSSSSSGRGSAVGTGLDARLGTTAASDTTSGLLFNAVLALVAHQKGPDVEADIRASALDPQPYRDDFPYRTSDFLRVLYGSAKVLCPPDAPLDAGFETLGMAAMDAILRSALGNRLGQVTEGRDGGRFVAPILSALKSVVTPGERKVETAGSRSATVSHKHDVLPAAFYRGVLSRAFSKLKNSHIKVEIENQTRDSIRYRVVW